MLVNLRSITTKSAKLFTGTGTRAMSSFEPPEHKLFMQAKPMRR